MTVDCKYYTCQGDATLQLLPLTLMLNTMKKVTACGHPQRCNAFGNMKHAYGQEEPSMVKQNYSP